MGRKAKMSTLLNENRRFSLDDAVRLGGRALHRHLVLIYQSVCLDERSADLDQVRAAVASSLAEQARFAPAPPKQTSALPKS